MGAETQKVQNDQNRISDPVPTFTGSNAVQSAGAPGQFVVTGGANGARVETTNEERATNKHASEQTESLVGHDRGQWAN